MGKLETLSRNFYKPRWWLESAIPFGRAVVDREISKLTYSPNELPISVMKEDWDTLVILDACRYDLFEKANILPGELSYRISPASATPEFLAHNFENEKYDDTVYVTANPMYVAEGFENSFHRTVDVWQDSWDHDEHTVRPEDMKEATIAAHEEYPNKRIISHFNQPHYPFIGEKGKQIGQHAGSEHTYRKATGQKAEREHPTIWTLLEQGKVSRHLAWEAYQENLELALPHVEEILKKLNGKSVVTSDHGNLFGERPFRFAGPVYGHPVGFRCKHLCKVPWLEHESGERRRIQSQSSKDVSGIDSSAISERLSDLGYINK